MVTKHASNLLSLNLSGIRYPSGAGVGQGAGKPGKGTESSLFKVPHLTKSMKEKA